MNRVVVIGAGLLGASVARQLARMGAQVIVLERVRPGAGTSGRSFAWLNAQDKEPAAYFDLNVDGIREYEVVRRDLGDAWYHAGGDLAIGWGADGPLVREKAERHASAGYPVELLAPARLAELEPSVVLPTGTEDAVLAWYPDEAWVDPQALIAGLLGDAARAGAEIRDRSSVARLAADGGQVAAVLGSGERVEGDRVVVAAGPASGDLLATMGARLPMSPTPGLLAITAPVPMVVRRVIHVSRSVSVRPDGGGRLMLAARGVDNALDPEMTSVSPGGAELATLLARATAILPGLAGTPIESSRIGIRSVAVDGKPVVGPVPGAEGVYALVSHSGVTLAALLGRLAAEELHGREQARLAPYRMSRFAVA